MYDVVGKPLINRHSGVRQWYVTSLCKRKVLKVNSVKNMVIVLKGEMGLVCEFTADEEHLKHASEVSSLDLCLSVRHRWSGM